MTRLPYEWRPGAGFVLLALSALGAAAFFLWGWSTPLLDHVGRYELELKIGRRPPLDAEEFDRVQRALCEHPKLAEDWLEGADIGLISAHRHGLVENGYAYVVRLPEAAAREVVMTQAAGEKKRRLFVEARTRRDRDSGSIGAEEPYRWAAPAFKDCPTLIELRVTDGGDKRKPARARVTFGGAR